MSAFLRSRLPISSQGKVLEDYNAGIRSVQETVTAVNSWDEFPVREIFGLLSEERLFELLQALIQDDPSLPARCLPQQQGTLLHHALAWRTETFDFDPPANLSARALELLSPPEVTRVQGECRAHRRNFHGLPLHLAAIAGGAYLGLITDRLLRLDPDVLLIANSAGQLPLHLAFLAPHRLPLTALARMVELRPTSLLHRDGLGRSPVALALVCGINPNDPGLPELLTSCVARFPEALRPPKPNSKPKPNEAPGPGSANEDTTPLMGACQLFSGHPDLVRAVVNADPSALAVPLRRPWRQVPSPLPFQVVRAEAAVAVAAAAAAAGTPALNELARFLEDETLHLALAAAEYYAMGLGGGGATPEVAEEQDAATAFQRRLRDVLPRYLTDPAPDVAARLHEEGSTQRKRRRRRPHPPPPRPSAFVVAQSIRELDNRMVFCQELFLRPFRRDLLLGDAVISLYLLNRRQDRSNPNPCRQVQMLASVSDHLDCLYLQFREHGSRLLIS